jgi:hypothetical protein
VRHGHYPYLFDDVLLRLIARWLHPANQRICKMALCLKTPVTLRWTRELRAGYTLIYRLLDLKGCFLDEVRNFSIQVRCGLHKLFLRHRAYLQQRGWPIIGET